MDNFYELFLNSKLNWTNRELVCIFSILIATVIILFILLAKKKIKLFQAISAFLLTVFLCLLFSYCVFTRLPKSKPYYNLELFWSWRRALDGNAYLQQEILLNIVLLMPVGFLMPVMIDKKVSWWKGLLVGLFLSACIEVLQLVPRRGLFEWDDMLHNSIGCMIGTIASSYIIRKTTQKQGGGKV